MKNVTQIAREREAINNTIRSYLSGLGSIEVETPLLVASPGMEPNLFPFETEVLEPGGQKFVGGLITSPEYSMKKLLGLGLERTFTITKVFRNMENLGGEHNPEFSMLEWYQQGDDYHVCMDQTEEIIRRCAKALNVNIPQDFERKTLQELFLEHANLYMQSANKSALRNACIRLGIETDESDTESDLFYRLFLTKIEPTFKGKNIFVYNYPKYQAALAALTPDGAFGQRFELYMNGLELCNGFTELTDPQEQRERFQEEADERSELGKTVFPIDEELLKLLGSMHNPTFGNALGIDRLHMVLTGRSSINDVLLFPASELFS
jgi:elongation factor P--(R)-beta-lysine ligase